MRRMPQPFDSPGKPNTYTLHPMSMPDHGINVLMVRYSCTGEINRVQWIMFPDDNAGGSDVRVPEGYD